MFGSPAETVWRAVESLLEKLKGFARFCRVFSSTQKAFFEPMAGSWCVDISRTIIVLALD